MKENLHFKQLQLYLINNKKKTKTKIKTKQEHQKLVISSIRVDVVPKTDDEVYVLSTIKIYSYCSFVFSIVPKKVELLKIPKVLKLF